MDPHRLNADLHCHSYRSDGTLPPAEVVRRAHANGVEILALTDHDELSGLAEAAETARALGLWFVPGVEISVTWADETIHVVGLGVDPSHEGLREGLRNTRAGRERRGRDMAQQLAEAGWPGAFEGALAYVGNPDLITRTHFARWLVEVGACRDVREVFTRYLTKDKPGYVPMQWARLSDAVAWIHAAGGQAVLAHPARYKLSDTEQWALCSEFRDSGGVGIEVVTGSHSADEARKYAQVATEFGFLASRGSDFHGPGESRLDLGQLPDLPDSVVPIWHNWAPC
jgi:predicted metal-dependent phosphoesterase TrpH